MMFQKEQDRKELLYLILLPFLLTLLPLTALLGFLIYIVVYLISCFFSNYGKFISYFDVWLDEDCVNKVPENSIVISLILQGDISLVQLKSVFTENVLNAPSKVNPKILRYPELKQYLSTFICFRIWKNDPNFLLENHIVEKLWNGSDLSNIHQEYQNKLYEKCRSPWEMVLFRNINLNDDSENVSKSLLIFRVHHVMADAKSVQKLLVECLGNKPIKAASPLRIQTRRFDALRFALSFPWKSIHAIYTHTMLFNSSYSHPWGLQSFLKKPSYESNRTIMAFSPKINMLDVKQVAKQNSVKPSAVIMSIIAGAINKYLGDKWDKEVKIAYPLPKPNHPAYMTNHMYLSILGLATDEQCAFKRLQQCNIDYVRELETEQVRYTNVGIFLTGLQLYPMSCLLSNIPVPICITNNAGDEEGFSVGNAECIDFRMTVGTLRGAVSVMFCTSSYKNEMRIAVIAKESVFSKEIANSLANQIEYELKFLMGSC